MRILYLRPHRRRPVITGNSLWAEDVQGAVPPAWCRGCGKEVFEPGQASCPNCQKEEQYE